MALVGEIVVRSQVQDRHKDIDQSLDSLLEHENAAEYIA